MNRSIMVVGAHADDIEINAGGTIAKYVDRGYRIVYVMSTNNMSGITQALQPDGSVTRTIETPTPMMARRKRECDDAAAMMNVTPIHLDHPQRHYNGPDGKQKELRYGCELPEGVPADVPSILTAYEDPASRQRLTDLILQTKPECVLTHAMAEINIEHVGTSLLVTRSVGQAVAAGYKGALLHWRRVFPELGEVNARWDTYVDITGYLDARMRLIGAHRCQLPLAHRPDFPHRTRVLEWGGKCGCEAAEVFYWVRRPKIAADEPCASDSLTAELMTHTEQVEPALPVGSVN
jgi:LmbE family N-acetylglucosaminyl deacetylase